MGFRGYQHVLERERFVLTCPEYKHFMQLTKELLMHLMDAWQMAFFLET